MLKMASHCMDTGHEIGSEICYPFIISFASMTTVSLCQTVAAVVPTDVSKSLKVAFFYLFVINFFINLVAPKSSNSYRFSKIKCLSFDRISTEM